MNAPPSAEQRARAIRNMIADNWRVTARESEPKAWESFRRALKAKPLCDNDRSMDRELWEAFLQGWKRRARAWPFNTATGWVRRAIRGG
jgi:hypothetical protein